MHFSGKSFTQHGFHRLKGGVFLCYANRFLDSPIFQRALNALAASFTACFRLTDTSR